MHNFLLVLGYIYTRCVQKVLSLYLPREKEHEWNVNFLWNCYFGVQITYSTKFYIIRGLWKSYFDFIWSCATQFIFMSFVTSNLTLKMKDEMEAFVA